MRQDTSGEPPDELNKLVEAGAGEDLPDYGFPGCYGRALVDPVDDAMGRPFNPAGNCDAYVAATAEIPSHGAALGLRFYNETAFPERYRGLAFVAEHGSWNRWPPSGYTVSMVDTSQVGTAADDSYEEFLTGMRLAPERSCVTSADCPVGSTLCIPLSFPCPSIVCSLSFPCPCTVSSLPLHRGFCCDRATQHARMELQTSDRPGCAAAVAGRSTSRCCATARCWSPTT